LLSGAYRAGGDTHAYKRRQNRSVQLSLGAIAGHAVLRISR
jgi:hypothetical protein